MNNHLSITSFSIAIWNANGAKQKYIEISNFLHEHDIDVFVMTETHLSPDTRLNFANYNTFRTDRIHHRGGGSLILTKRAIDASLISTDREHGYETTTVRIKLTKYGAVNITSMYSPPDNRLDRSDLERLFPSNQKTLLAGDLNAKNIAWGCRRNNANGSLLQDFMEEQDIFIHPPDKPTHYPLNCQAPPEFLDFAFTNFQIIASNITLDELSSDHLPTIMFINEASIKQTVERKTTDWTLYANILEIRHHQITEITSEAEIEKSIKNLQEDLLYAYNQATEMKRTQSDYIKLPFRIKEKIKLKNRVTKMWKRTLNPAYKIEINKLNREIKAEVTAIREENWAEKIISVSQDPKKLWQSVKNLKTEKIPNKPIEREDGSLCYEVHEKAEAVADSLESQFRPNETEMGYAGHERYVLDTVTDYLRSQQHLLREHPSICSVCKNENCINKNICDTEADIRYLTNSQEIIDTAKTLKTRKAPSTDNITNQMIKSMPILFYNHLTIIFNYCLSASYFPKVWKKASVILFPKPGTQHNRMANYRPISLLPCIGKLFEKIFIKRLHLYSSKIPDTQMGFLKKRSTTHQLVKLNEIIAEAIIKNQYTTVLYLDAAKAFDRVHHESLLFKLISNNVSPNLILLIRSYLSHRTFRVKINSHLSTEREIAASVAQGSIAGPILFLHYVSDFPNWPEDRLASLNQYADDVAITQSSINPNRALIKLQDKISEVEDWCSKWKIKINSSKTTYMTIHRGRNKKCTRNLSFNGINLRRETKTKYLGLTINSRLTFENHAKIVIAKANNMFNCLRPLLSGHSRLDIKKKLQLIMTCIRSQITYASPAWPTILDTTKKKIDGCINGKIRKALKVPRYLKNEHLFEDLQIMPTSEFMNLQNCKFYKENIRNAIMKQFLMYQINMEDIHIRPFANVACNNSDLYDLYCEETAS